ncbi:MAG: acyltransferase [Sphingobacteriales bacterium]|nr:acyltransferase [Sphingobacteriales bacterium]
MKQTKLPSLDGLRGIAILIVIFAHFNNHWHFKFLGLLVNAGIFGVYIFFVLSGFLITTLLLRERDENHNINLSNFYKRRALRIVPLSWFYVIVTILISVIVQKPSLIENFWIPSLYLVNISGIGAVSYNFLHYWSLSAEEQYYLIIPPFMKYKPNQIKIILFIILILTFSVRFLSRYSSSFYISVLIDISRNMDGLLIGSILALFYHTGKIKINQLLLKYRDVINILGLLMLMILNHETNYLILKIFANHTFYSLIIGFIIVLNLQPSEDYSFRFLNSKILSQIGVISYSIYIWQQLFSSDIIPFPTIINFLLTFIVAWLSYHYFEKPFLKLKKRYAT